MAEVVIDESRVGDIAGKVAIVTGGASGIGKGIVLELLKRNATVVFCDLNEAAGNQVISGLHGTVKFIKCNVLVWSELRNVFTQAKNIFGHVDIVFANAGVVQSSSIWDDKLDENGELAEPEMLTLDVCLKSVVATAKLAMHHFKQNSPPGGSLVISASSSSYNERPQLPLYSTAKHGLLGLLRSMRSEAPKVGVSVAAIAPGGTATGMVDPTIVKSMQENGITVQTPEYVALAAVMLASDKAWNGKCVTLLEFKATEVEEAIKETMPTWFGKWNMEVAAKAAKVVVNK